MKIDKDGRIDRAIIGLSRGANKGFFTELTTWLEESREDQRTANDSQRDDVELRQGQGRSQVLTEMLEKIATASERRAKKRPSSGTTTGNF